MLVWDIGGKGDAISGEKNMVTFFDASNRLLQKAANIGADKHKETHMLLC